MVRTGTSTSRNWKAKCTTIFPSQHIAARWQSQARVSFIPFQENLGIFYVCPNCTDNFHGLTLKPMSDSSENIISTLSTGTATYVIEIFTKTKPPTSIAFKLWRSSWKLNCNTFLAVPNKRVGFIRFETWAIELTNQKCNGPHWDCRIHRTTVSDFSGVPEISKISKMRQSGFEPPPYTIGWPFFTVKPTGSPSPRIN